MALRRRANWTVALLEQSYIPRSPRGLWMSSAAGSHATNDRVTARGCAHLRTAAGAALARREHDDLFIVQSGIHARASDAVVGFEVPRLDVWCEVDSVGRGARFREQTPAPVAAGI